MKRQGGKGASRFHPALKCMVFISKTREWVRMIFSWSRDMYSFKGPTKTCEIEKNRHYHNILWNEVVRMRLGCGGWSILPVCLLIRNVNNSFFAEGAKMWSCFYSFEHMLCGSIEINAGFVLSNELIKEEFKLCHERFWISDRTIKRFYRWYECVKLGEWLRVFVTASYYHSSLIKRWLPMLSTDIFSHST